MELLTEEADQITVRTKRSAEVCKYKKGEWAECDRLTMVNLLQFSPPGRLEWKCINYGPAALLVSASQSPQTANNKSFQN